MIRRRLVILLLIILLLALGSLALAQVQSPTLPWWTVDGGGGASSGGSYAISGTIGQPEAGELSGDGHYTVSGGFWGASSPPLGDLFLPFVQRL